MDTGGHLTRTWRQFSEVTGAAPLLVQGHSGQRAGDVGRQPGGHVGGGGRGGGHGVGRGVCVEGVGRVVHGRLLVPVTGVAGTSVDTLVTRPGHVTCHVTCGWRVKVLGTVTTGYWSSHWSFLKIVT